MLQKSPNSNWTHSGLILPRNNNGLGSEVMGDPCIIWDDTIGNWRMILFASPPGHGQAIHLGDITKIGPGSWVFEGSLPFTNPGSLGEAGATHKPFVVLDPYRPNRPARINGQYSLVTVSRFSERKEVQQAWAEELRGPWTVEERIIIPVGDDNAFDAKHTDAVSAYYFEERNEILYFYMGYPKTAQPHTLSPYGSSLGAAVRRVGKSEVTKLGIVLAPSELPGHWASGYVGGFQILPGREHRWIAVANASPTAPNPVDFNMWREEPPPSLGGLAYTDEEWPVSGWQWYPEPIEWIEDLPPEAVKLGEGVNLWRHYLLVLPDGNLGLFYNSGRYGEEQLYLKLISQEDLKVLQ